MSPYSLVEIGLALSAQASLALKYWMQSFQMAAYLINLLPTKVLSYQSPIQLLFHKAPKYTHLRIFGCLYFPSLRPYMTNKLSYRFTPFFLGYAPSHKGYLCLDTKTDRFYISWHVIFMKIHFRFSLPWSHQILLPLQMFSQFSHQTCYLNRCILLQIPHPCVPHHLLHPYLLCYQFLLHNLILPNPFLLLPQILIP